VRVKPIVAVTSTASTAIPAVTSTSTHPEDSAAPAPVATVSGDGTLRDGSLLPKSGMSNAMGQVKFNPKSTEVGTYLSCVTGMDSAGHL
jgi:hypothetical protein